MPATVFPAPGASSGIQWNTYTSTTTASSSGSTVTITGTTDSRWVGTTPVVNSGTGQFANNTIITSVINSNSFSVNIAPTVALSSASITISEGAINGITDNRLTGKTKDGFLARGSASLNTISIGKTKDGFVARGGASSNNILVTNLQKQIEVIRGGASINSLANTYNVNKLKIPYTNTEVFYTTSLFGKTKDNFLAKGSINNILTTNLQKQLEVIRGSASPNLILTTNLQKQLEIIKNPTPNDTVVWDINNITKLKIPYTNAEVFYTISSSNLQKQIEVVRGGASSNNILTSNLQKQIEVVRGGASRNIILTGKAQDNYVARGSASPNTILLNNINKLKVPYTNTEVFYTISSSNMQKQFEIVRGGASSNNILTSNLQKQLEIVRGGASSNNILTSNLQKQIGIIKNPTPTDAIVWDTNNITKLKVPYTNTEVFYAASLFGKAQDNYVARGSASPNTVLTGKAQDIYVARGSASPNTVSLSNINKLKIPYTNTEVFYAASLFGKAQDNYVARGSASPNTVSLSNINSTILQSTVFTTTSTGIPRENLYYAQIAQGRYGSRFPYFYPAAMPNNLSPSNLQKQIEIVRGGTSRNIILTGKAQDSFVVRGSSSPNTVLSANLQNFYNQTYTSATVSISSSGILLSGGNLLYYLIYNSTTPANPNWIGWTVTSSGQANSGVYPTGTVVTSVSGNTIYISQAPTSLPSNSTVLLFAPGISTTTSTGVPRENLYYAQIAQGRYGSRFPYFYPAAMANNIISTNLQKQIEVIKNPVPNDAVFWDAYNINKLKVPYTNTEVFYTAAISNLQKQLEVIKNPVPNEATIWDISNLQKQLEVVKNPVPNEATIWDVYNVNKLKVPYTKIGLFFSPSISNLQKPIEVIKNPVPKEATVYDVSIIGDGYRAKGIGNISYLSLINRVEKQKINISTTEVFFSPNYGSVIKLKTGSSPGLGIADPAFNRSSIPVPIQFWN